MINITKDTIIGDILDVAPQTAPIFLSIGMHCLGCPSSRGETVEEACMVHGIDVDQAAGSGERGSQQGSVIAPLDRTHTGYRMRPEPCPERTESVHRREGKVCAENSGRVFCAISIKRFFSMKNPAPQERSSCGDAYGKSHMPS